MKFSQLAAGKTAEKPIAFEVLGPDGEAVEAKCLAVPLSGFEEGQALQFASEYAASRGEKDPKVGSSLWDLGYMVKVIQIGCLDPDSPEKKRERFFASTDEVLSLPRETIAYVFELQQTHQDRVSPTAKRMPAAELLQRARQIAEEDDERPFLQLSPGLRWIFVRFLASLLFTSPEASSPGSSPTVSTGPSLSEKNPSEPPPSESSDEPPSRSADTPMGEP